MSELRHHCVIGVDGGGSTTGCCVLDGNTGALLGSASSGCSNRNSSGEHAAGRQLKQAVEAALAAAGQGVQDVAAACFCMSGVDTAQDEKQLEASVRAWLPPQALVSVHNDALAALCAGTGGQHEGCVLIAGTGTIAYGVRPCGRAARAAGWGGAFLDGGSGYDLGQRALAAVARAADGRGPPTALLGAVCAACSVPAEHPQQLLSWAYADPAWARIAQLAPCVLRCTEEGDEVAAGMLDAASEELATSLLAVCRRLELLPASGCTEEEGSLAVVLAGGLLQPGSPYSQRLRLLLAARLPAARLVHPSCDPAQGAALLAWRKLQPHGQPAVATADSAPEQESE